eukprot:CAMPEP_0179436990 /NCGR_PEP_ID=MMETSP0799-20121207/20957_1 /TAXON_ID=46947 /ORGANISM="Geminigera cryophila, Strain CCMP2564" /LENGTH=215 /DNA_ID=CAMNT_0021217627 /DNA_START=18 /DNA_END=665 /DNA_ORIENTATION=-
MANMNSPSLRPMLSVAMAAAAPHTDPEHIMKPYLARRAAIFSFAAAGVAVLAPARSAQAAEDLAASYKLVEFLQDAKSLGNVRFTTVNTFGSVVEGAGRLDFEMNAFEIPMGTPGMIGQYIRFSGPNSGEHLVANFECSINLDNCNKVEFVELYGPLGPLYCFRIVDAKGGKIVTVSLNYDVEGNGNKGGTYKKGQVENFQALRKKWGDVIKLQG